MSKKRAYRAVLVQAVDRARILEKLRNQVSAAVGIDVGKEYLWACLRYGDGSFERPWKAKNTWELGELVDLFSELNSCRPLPIGLESTGTYGDALRQSLTDAHLDVRRVSGKAGSDYAEVFDGVPSQHDGKDAAVIAELVALGKSRAWPWRAPSETDQELKSWVEWLFLHQQDEARWLGRLEALLARYWPEATSELSLGTYTLIRALSHYGGPSSLVADSEAAKRLSLWGRTKLTPEKIEDLISSARHTVGVRMNESAREQVRRYANEVQRCREAQKKAEQTLTQRAAHNPTIHAQRPAVGLVTACLAWVALGNPRDYDSGASYRKAMGLNLKERSSGKHQGQLKISKRGSSMLRRSLYFSALRECQKPGVKEWYEAKKTKDKRGGRAIIGIMRKLALVMYTLATSDATYDPRKLLPGAPLNRAKHEVPV